MTISELMDALASAQNKHGDLDVFAVVDSKEYAVDSAFWADDGPLATNEARSKQHDLPERLVIELDEF